MKSSFIIFLLILIGTVDLSAKIDPEIREFLSPEEIAWLKDHPEIRVANEMDWPPFDYNESGKPKGLAIDYIKAIAGKLGLKLKFINGFTWSELVDLFEQRKIDVMPVFYYNKEREKFTLYTQPYFRGKLSVFTNMDHPNPELTSSRVGMETSHGSIPIVKKHIPGIKIIEINKKDDLVRKLAFGELDAIIGNPFVFYHISRENQLDNIQISNYLILSDEEQQATSFHVGIRKDWPIFHGILEKVMFNMHDDELEQIKNRWADISIIQQPNWLLIAQVSGVIFIIILFLVWNNRLLKSMVKTKTTELKKLNEDLEVKVNARTKDLVNLNNRLESEVEQRTADYKKAKEEAEKANELKSRIMANITHELRTPMHAILSFSEFGINRQETLKKEKILHYFTQINQAGSHLMGLIQDLLDLSQMESGDSPLELAGIDLKTIIESVVSNAQPSITQKSLKVVIAPFKGPTIVVCDQQRMEQVFRKLLHNAVKYSTSNQTITISFDDSALQISKLMFPALKVSLTDQGIGIPNDELLTIFDKFRESSKTESGSGGRGLGLAICSEIIKRHQGRIWAENQPDGGAVFHVLLPYKQIH